MNLYEYMGKELLARYGIPIQSGRLVETPAEAIEASRNLGGEVVLKAQVLSGKRGRGGGIAFATDPPEAGNEAERLLGLELNGERVKRLLVAERKEIDHEFYLAITIDQRRRSPLVLASAHGGIDVEDFPPGKMIRLPVDLAIGYHANMGREAVSAIGLPEKVAGQFSLVLDRLLTMFREIDAELVEINPLALCGSELIAIDAKVTIDDDALYRQPDLPRVEERTGLEGRAYRKGIVYLSLGGDIAVMANGAGITMATVDMVQHFGGSPANFIDLGGGAGMEKTLQALEILLAADPEVILINIFGGITRCDDVARALAELKESGKIDVPCFVRLVGTNEERGREILHGHAVEVYHSMEEAVHRAVEASPKAGK
ncbi:MAG: ADP-forming succinate--CoA ligase subunit beta [Firmicutes bacterium]|jgi:succinyl-CoA synthetase beta subunit|nr:ADP-forming succinate--CoA ligase subunit beta [Bacillota bacterium]